MFKNCYKHHKSDLIDACFLENEETVNKIIQLFSSDSVTLDIRSIFYTYNLAEYLQIDLLKNLYLDHFTLNFN